jgi:hypothetical protein
MNVDAITQVINDFELSISPVHFARNWIDPDPWQKEVLLSHEQQCLVLAGRQQGKTEIVSILALWHALTTPYAVVVCIAPALRQSGILFKMIYDKWRDCGKPYGSEIESALTLTLGNRSKIIALPPGREGTNIRGYTASLLLFDEMARIPNKVLVSARPYLATSKGRMIGISSAGLKYGQFYDLWTKGGPDIHRWKVTAEENPRISKEWLATEKAISERDYAAEYLCEFQDVTESPAFSSQTIKDSVSTDVAPLDIRLELTEDYIS